jgi:BatD DUF11 like domain
VKRSASVFMGALARLAFRATLAVSVTAPTRAWAAGTQLQAEGHEFGAGQSFQLRLELDAELDEAPALRVPAGTRVLGQSSGPFHSMTSVNGRVTIRNGSITTWTLRVDKPGKYKLGPAVAKTKKGTVTSDLFEVEVSKDAPTPADPFDMMFRDLTQRRFREEDQEEADPALALPEQRAGGKDFFLHAHTDKTRAYVGEQVTLTHTLYLNEQRPEPDLFDLKESTCDQCLAFDHSDQRGGKVGVGLVGSTRYIVKQIRKTAYFPMVAGTVTVLPMSVSGGKKRAHYESEAVVLTVLEPPKAGRPPGYVLGDTGSFALSCEKSAQTVEAEGSIVVTAKLTGTGNFPNKLSLPAVRNLNFLEPQVSEAIGPDSAQAGARAGSKTFTYVVRADAAGMLNLGSIRFPFFNPKTEKYALAECELGKLKVTGDGKQTTKDEASLALLPAMKTLAQKARSGDAKISDAPWFYGVGFGFPLAAAALAFAPRREKKAERNSGAKQLAKEARRASDPKASARLLIKALEAHVEFASGVSIRGLSQEGAREALGDAAKAVLAHLEARASLEALGYDRTASLADLQQRVEKLVS